MENTHYKDLPAVRAAAAKFPGLRPGAIISNNGKVVVLSAELGQRAVVLKILINQQPPLPQIFARELAVLEAFLHKAPPFPTPRVIAVDRETGFSLLEELKGQQPPAPQRL